MVRVFQQFRNDDWTFFHFFFTKRILVLDSERIWKSYWISPRVILFFYLCTSFFSTSLYYIYVLIFNCISLSTYTEIRIHSNRRYINSTHSAYTVYTITRKINKAMAAFLFFHNAQHHAMSIFLFFFIFRASHVRSKPIFVVINRWKGWRCVIGLRFSTVYNNM